MAYQLSRDFLDGLMIQHPKSSGEAELSANANVRFLPSSPDGTMHTALVTLIIGTGDEKEGVMAQAAWRYLFTSEEAQNPAEDSENQFFKQMLVAGVSRIIAVLNPMCMHAAMPLIPLDANQLVRQMENQDKAKE